MNAHISGKLLQEGHPGMTLAVFHGYLQQIKLTSFCHGFNHYHELQCEKTGLREFQPGVTQNWPVYLQNMARSLKFWIYVEEELYYLKSENKFTDQLCSYYCTADLHLCFRMGKKSGFLMTRLICIQAL